MRTQDEAIDAVAAEYGVHREAVVEAIDKAMEKMTAWFTEQFLKSCEGLTGFHTGGTIRR